MGVSRSFIRAMADGWKSVRVGPDQASIRLARWLVPACAAACGMLAIAGFVRKGNPVRYFGDFRWGTLLSAGLLLLGAIAAVRNWRALRGTLVAPAWLALGCGLGAAMLDDALALHERVDLLINQTLGWNAAGDGDFIDDALILLYALIIGSIMWVYGARCFARQRALVWCWGAAFGFYTVMVVLDFMDRFQTVEESSKILAAACIYCGARAVRGDPLFERLMLRAQAGQSREAPERPSGMSHVVA